MDAPLILSIFPGVLFEAKLFGCRYSSMDHGMMIRAKNPNVFALTVGSPNGNSVSFLFVVDVDDLVFSTDHAFSWHIGTPPEETGYGARPASEADELFSFLVARISSKKALPHLAMRLFDARIRTVFSSPVIAIPARKRGSADTALPFNIGWLATVILEIPFPGAPARATHGRAETLIDFVGPVFFRAVSAPPCWIRRENCAPMSSALHSDLLECHAR